MARGVLCPHWVSQGRLSITMADDAKPHPATSCLWTRLREAAHRITLCQMRSAEGRQPCYRRQRSCNLLASRRKSDAIGVRHYKSTMVRGAWGLYPNGPGPERASDCAVGVSDAASRQRVTEKERATARKGDIPSNPARPERRRHADARQRSKERSLTMRPW
jgi:hypothetical protein